MDRNQLIGLVALLLSALLLIVISSAEAGIAAISRSRMRERQANGNGDILNIYVRRRHAILSGLSVGATIATVVATAAVALLAVDGREVTPASVSVVVLISIATATLLRQSARAIALISPEATGERLARPIRLLRLVLEPVAWAVNAPVHLLLRLFDQAAPAEADAAEELLAVLDVAPGPDNDETLAEERRMMRGILAMSNQTVREIMSPRMDITAVSIDASVGDVLKVVNESGFSRIPLYEESIDRVVGVVYAKDLLAYLLTGDVQPDLREIARPPYFVPETKRANDLLAEMRRDQVHMAIAVDEYGGTAGVATVEDLIEEIVGEIADEYDTEEVEVERLNDDAAIVDARLPVDDLNELFNTDVESDDFDTVGGLVFSLLGRLAVPGDEVESADHGLQLRVLSVLGRRIQKVRIQRLAPITEEASAVE